MRILTACIVFVAGMAAGRVVYVLQSRLVQRECGVGPSPITQLQRAEQKVSWQTSVLLGLLWTLFFVSCKRVEDSLLLCFLSSGLWVTAWVDLLTHRIPAEMQIWVMLAGVLRIATGGISPIMALAGMVAISVPLLLLDLRGGGLGGGDIKLVAGIGLVVGPEQCLYMLALAMILCLTVERPRQGQAMIPLGPYLAVGTLLLLNGVSVR